MTRSSVSRCCAAVGACAVVGMGLLAGCSPRTEQPAPSTETASVSPSEKRAGRITTTPNLDIDSFRPSTQSESTYAPSWDGNDCGAAGHLCDGRRD